MVKIEYTFYAQQSMNQAKWNTLQVLSSEKNHETVNLRFWCSAKIKYGFLKGCFIVC